MAKFIKVHESGLGNLFINVDHIVSFKLTSESPGSKIVLLRDSHLVDESTDEINRLINAPPLPSQRSGLP